jgi:WhiB family redox-sensing transcriptional regulator
MAGWRDRAVCVGGEPEIFFPSEPSHPNAYAVARAVCAQCPVRAECFNAAASAEGGRAADYRYGMWGGLTPEERASRHRAARKAETP